MGAATADAIDFEQADLGDLAISEALIPDWDHNDHLPLDTSTWTQVAMGCPNESQLRAFIAAATAKTVLNFNANCTIAAAQPFDIPKNQLVIRGSNRDTSVVQFSNITNHGFQLGSWQAPAAFEQSRTWTSGFTLGTTVLGVANVAGLSPGDWVQVRTNIPPGFHAQTVWDYKAKLSCVQTLGVTGEDCSGMAANTVRLDRPLRSDYTASNPALLVRNSSIQHYYHLGLERLKITHTTPFLIWSYRPRVLIYRCYECWVTDTVMGDAGNAFVIYTDSVRNLIRGNDFGSTQCTQSNPPFGTCAWNKGAIYDGTRSHDNVFENNSVSDSPSGPLLEGGSGSIVAYNYLKAGAGVVCERGIFLHGRGVNATLVEGNDTGCAGQWDSFRNGQGYYNMWYGNRMRGDDSGLNYTNSFRRGRIGPEIQGNFEHKFMHVIANHVDKLNAGPSTIFDTQGIDASLSGSQRHSEFHAEYNMARASHTFSSSGFAVSTFAANNEVGTSPAAGWSGRTFPPSMYRTSAPSWWCEASGAFPNIGGPYDDAASYSKLPAQIRLEGGACVGGAQMCGNGVIESGEQCDDGGTQAGDCCSPTCQFEPATTLCRAAAGSCDVAETCTGTAASCPADVLVPAATECRASGGQCDIAETCSGTAAACPVDVLVLVPAVTECRASTGICDVAETCDGIAPTCPADAFESAGTMCRTSAGPCDVSEQCTGTGAACAADVFESAGTLCRASAGSCDVSEQCTGTGAACPADRFKRVYFLCRLPADLCDVSEWCTGTGAVCPSDGFASPAIVCRAPVGWCDVFEQCTGTGAACPADGFAAAGTLCRTSAGVCDVSEQCTGTGSLCPSDGYAPVTTPCDDGVACTENETCNGAGACASGAPNDSLCQIGNVCDPTFDCQPLAPIAPPPPLAVGDCPAESCTPVPTASPDGRVLLIFLVLGAGAVLLLRPRRKSS